MSGRDQGVTVEFKVHFAQGRRGERVISPGAPPRPSPPVAAGSVPRVARLMALALRMEDLVRRGEVDDYADLAELGHVTRARVSQIVNLLNLAPDIIEEILFLPNVAGERDAVPERLLRSIAVQGDWRTQRIRWRAARPPKPNCRVPTGGSHR